MREEERSVKIMNGTYLSVWPVMSTLSPDP